MLEQYFSQFRQGIIGIDACIESPDGTSRPIVYADWTASGRNYLPIEKRIQEEIMPYVANTHTEASDTGMATTHAYKSAQKLIKEHVNASSTDVILTTDSGMTGVVNKFQRILGFRSNAPQHHLKEAERPVVFVTHMEHHSNHTSWLETIATVEVIPPNGDGLVDLQALTALLGKYKERPMKIASVTACSNVTGIGTPIHQIAKLMHEAHGYCFVDYACSAPYVDIDMHPEEQGVHLDAIFFSPHKFLGGPGSSGVLVFNSALYHNEVPDHPGGDTVEWTNPWGGHKYFEDIEVREDGGTPAFLQTIKAAMCISLKLEMGVENIQKREHYLNNLFFDGISNISNLLVLESNRLDRLAIFSFCVAELNYNLGVRMLNDRFGIQCRGGCSCAGTYGHHLFGIDQAQSKTITDRIDIGDLSQKPGWIRVSLHPTMTDKEVLFIVDSVQSLAKNQRNWSQDYELNADSGQYQFCLNNSTSRLKNRIKEQLTAKFI
ncbi:MAG: aminotransferase class V-fold PLP-dependent enzyme [Gammaproteobacteria bacterium]